MSEVLAGGDKIGDASDGNLSEPIYVHSIPLHDEFDDVIDPESDLAYPFSVKATCGQCHAIDTIRGGWHFNAISGDADPGSNGEPWIYVDHQTRTQVPLSYRKWRGAFHPEQFGLTRWKFACLFARHMPGGIGEDQDAEEPDLEARWMLSGELDVNCLACHESARTHDQAEYAVQTRRENFRWAPGASCQFAKVKGSAKNMEEFWDYTAGMSPDDPKKIPPAMSYDPRSFESDGKIFFDIRRRVLSEKCYFCHTTVNMDEQGQEKGNVDRDVHLAAGLNCVDCHRNGLDHKMNRGYAGETSVGDDPKRMSLTCKGCHLGVEGSATPYAGRLGAPRPEHKGIPTIHFDRLECTACHSGPWPDAKTHAVKTSRSHGLGLPLVNKSPEALPHIQSAIFTERQGEKLSPHKLIWPVYWAWLKKDNEIRPISPEVIKDIAGDILTETRPLPDGDWLALTTDQIGAVLDRLNGQAEEDSVSVYIAGGMLYRWSDDNKNKQLSIAKHESAEPYMWPIAHNVRPASQSLGLGGAKGCAHCHNRKAGFFFGDVAVDTPVVSDQGRTLRRVAFQETVDDTYAAVFSWSFVFRPWMKLAVAAASAILLFVLALYGLRALAAVTGFLAEQPNKIQTAEPELLPGWLVLIKGLIYLATGVCFVILAVTGMYPWLIGERLSGYLLMIHASISPVFGVCLALSAVLWAQQHRFKKTDIRCACRKACGTSLRPINEACLGQKFCFWIILVSTLPLILSILLSMLPLFGTDIQNLLFHTHRYSALVISVFLLLHTLLAANRRLKE